MPLEPNDVIAAAIAADVMGSPCDVSRFPTGLRHFVYEAKSVSSGATAVLRISRPNDIAVARDALYWSEMLRPRGVPLPEVLHTDLTMDRHPFPFLVLERLPGNDLGLLLDRLSDDALRSLANQLASIQERVTSLPHGNGFGFASRLNGPFRHRRWSDVITGSLDRSRRRIEAAGVLPWPFGDRIERAADILSDYFATVAPMPFLHDITTKNVIVEKTRLSGIVDVDDLCFGDPLFLVALIRVALMANGQATTYAEAWLEVLQPDARQRAALDFYTALFCLDFMGEVGHRFNRPEASPVDAQNVERLQSTLDRHLA